MASKVVTVDHENGDVSVGVEIDGVFHRVTGISAANIASGQERYDTLSEKVGKGEPGVDEAYERHFGAPPKKAEK